MKISVTERKTFKTCRRQWFYKHILRLVPKSLEDAAFWVGTGVHLGLQKYYESNRNPMEDKNSANRWGIVKGVIQTYLDKIDTEGKFDEELEEINKNKDLALGILAHYMTWAPKQDDFSVLETEYQMEVPVDGVDVILTGKTDLVVKDKGNLIWVMDHKTAVSFTPAQYWEVDDQLTAYMWLLSKVYKSDLSLAGGYHNTARKKIPVVPELLKSTTSLSKRANMDTTYSIYLSTIQQYGFDPNDYADMLAMLKEKGNNFFSREIVHRNEKELETFEKVLKCEVVDILCAHDIANDKANVVTGLNTMGDNKTVVSYDCPSICYPCPNPITCARMCKFNELCKYDNEQRDQRYLVDAMFIIKEKGSTEEAEIMEEKVEIDE